MTLWARALASGGGFAFAGRTDFFTLDLQTRSAAANGSPKIDVYLVFEIRSGLRAPAFRLLLSLGKDSGENVTEITPSAALLTLTLPRTCLVGLEIREIESAEVEGNALLFAVRGDGHTRRALRLPQQPGLSGQSRSRAGHRPCASYRR